MCKLRKATLSVLSTLCFCGCDQSADEGASLKTVDLRGAAIGFSPSNPRHAKAGQMLQEEIKKRTEIRLARSASMPAEDRPAIVLATAESLRGPYSPPEGLFVPQKGKGYTIWVDVEMRNAPTVYLVGLDDRGAFFAVGRLIRLASMACERPPPVG